MNTINPSKAAIDSILKQQTVEELLETLEKYGNKDSDYKVGTKIIVNNKMQKN